MAVSTPAGHTQTYGILKIGRDVQIPPVWTGKRWMSLSASVDKIGHEPGSDAHTPSRSV